MAQLESRIKDLERRLAAVTQERDELQKDVESLCLQTGGSMFSRSYVLTERIGKADAELKEERAKNVALSSERERLTDDLAKLRIAKLAGETLSAQLGIKLEQMDKDLAHYQVQLSKSLADRDQAQYESQRDRALVARAEESAKQATARAETAEAARAASEQELGQAREQLAAGKQELAARGVESEEARRKLRQAVDERKRLEGSVAALQAKATLYQSDLDRTRQVLQQSHETEGRYRVQLQEALAAASQWQGTAAGQAEVISRHNDEIAKLKADVAVRVGEIERLGSELAAAKEEAEKLRVQLAQQREELEEEVRSAQADARQAQQQLARETQQLAQQRQQWQQDGLMRASAGTAAVPAEAVTATSSRPDGTAADADASAVGPSGAQAAPGVGSGHAVKGARQSRDVGGGGGAHGEHSGVGEDEAEQLVILTRMVRELKIKLAQATQEKVEALMKVAAAGPGSGPGSGPSSQHRHSRRMTELDMGAAWTGSPSSPDDTTALSSSSPAAPSWLEGNWVPAFLSNRFVPPSLPASQSTATPLAAITSEGKPTSSTAKGAAQQQQQQQQQQQRGGVAASLAAASKGRKTEPGMVGSKGEVAVGSATTLKGSVATATNGVVAAQAAPSPAGGGVAATADGTALQESRAYLEGMKQVAALAQQYGQQLRASGEVVWSPCGDAAAKWSAITSLSKIHEDLGKVRAELGLPSGPGESTKQGKGAVKKAGAAFSGSAAVPAPQRELTKEVLELAEFGLQSLEQFSRQEALASVGMQY